MDFAASPGLHTRTRAVNTLRGTFTQSPTLVKLGRSDFPLQLSWKSAIGSVMIQVSSIQQKGTNKGQGHVFSVSSQTATKTTKRGFGSKTAANNAGKGLDVATLLRLSRKEWGRLQDEGGTRHYVISVKRKGGGSFSSYIPVAYLALLSEVEGSEGVKNVFPYLTREVLECAKLYSSLFASCRWNELVYAFEREDNFVKKDKVKRHMEKDLSSGKDQGESEREECPFAVLGLEEGASASEVRRAYRALAAVHHPDRHANTLEAEHNFKRIVGAYDRIKERAGGEMLVGGSTNSIENLIEIDIAEPKVSGSKLPNGIKAGVVPMDFNIIDLFVQDKRHQSVYEKL